MHICVSCSFNCIKAITSWQRLTKVRTLNRVNQIQSLIQNKFLHNQNW